MTRDVAVRGGAQAFTAPSNRCPPATDAIVRVPRDPARVHDTKTAAAESSQATIILARVAAQSVAPDMIEKISSDDTLGHSAAVRPQATLSTSRVGCGPA